MRERGADFSRGVSSSRSRMGMPKANVLPVPGPGLADQVVAIEGDRQRQRLDGERGGDALGLERGADGLGDAEVTKGLLARGSAA